MSLPRGQAWFSAKRYGYGWGLPARREGWVVFGIYLVAISGGFLLIPHHTILYFIYILAITSFLLAVCYWKGEPAKWRWGAKDQDR